MRSSAAAVPSRGWFTVDCSQPVDAVLHTRACCERTRWYFPKIKLYRNAPARANQQRGGCQHGACAKQHRHHYLCVRALSIHYPHTFTLLSLHQSKRRKIATPPPLLATTTVVYAFHKPLKMETSMAPKTRGSHIHGSMLNAVAEFGKRKEGKRAQSGRHSRMQPPSLCTMPPECSNIW